MKHLRSPVSSCKVCVSPIHHHNLPFMWSFLLIVSSEADGFTLVLLETMLRLAKTPKGVLCICIRRLESESVAIWRGGMRTCRSGLDIPKHFVSISHFPVDCLLWQETCKFSSDSVMYYLHCTFLPSCFSTLLELEQDLRVRETVLFFNCCHSGGLPLVCVKKNQRKSQVTHVMSVNFISSSLLY